MLCSLASAASLGACRRRTRASLKLRRHKCLSQAASPGGLNLAICDFLAKLPSRGLVLKTFSSEPSDQSPSNSHCTQRVRFQMVCSKVPESLQAPVWGGTPSTQVRMAPAARATSLALVSHAARFGRGTRESDMRKQKRVNEQKAISPY